MKHATLLILMGVLQLACSAILLAEVFEHETLLEVLDSVEALHNFAIGLSFLVVGTGFLILGSVWRYVERRFQKQAEKEE